MPNWRDQYLSGIKDAELNTPVNMELVQTCSQMADRISALEGEKNTLEALVANRGKTTAQSAEPSTNDPGVAQLKQDLAEALRSKGVTEKRLRASEEELMQLRSKHKADTKSIRDLTADKHSLTTRLKDREYELREKRKFIEDVQDEMIALNLQVSMAEKERDKVKKENKELIDRWMKRMAQEADAMNLANEPFFEKGR
ncbi:autophagy-related protein 16 [Fusarium flagelliforme]|uniref:Autophagy protein 16 n=1 Tax=Fusarium flagelliforme TaxID=2675880 RepID=A0A395MXX6_9HYPO|nr:autophagy-related protein 16 [Fusarium flagelliforme]KAH7192664.1 autophagy-related protein 16 [Fusarium flagelliforme]RFN52505.1 autophagy protein 16 [Fusarium flagelliforme]